MKPTPFIPGHASPNRRLTERHVIDHVNFKERTAYCSCGESVTREPCYSDHDCWAVLNDAFQVHRRLAVSV